MIFTCIHGGPIKCYHFSIIPKFSIVNLFKIFIQRFVTRNIKPTFNINEFVKSELCRERNKDLCSVCVWEWSLRGQSPSDKHLVDFLGDSSRCCLTISVLMAVLADLGLPLCPLFALVAYPVFLNFRRRCLIVSIHGGFLSGTSMTNRHWVWVTNFNSKYASTIFTLSFTVYCFRSIGVRIQCFVVSIFENKKNLFWK